MADTNPQNSSLPDRPEPTHTDQRINPVPDERERAEREANRLKDELEGRGIKVSHNTVWMFLRREGLSFKKNAVRP